MALVVALRRFRRFCLLCLFVVPPSIAGAVAVAVATTQTSQTSPAGDSPVGTGAETPPSPTPVQGVTRLGEVFASVARRVSPSVVSLRVRQRPAPPPGHADGVAPANRPGLTPRGGGSGIVVRSDGYILTNHHVIEGAGHIEVRLQGGETFSARLVGTDPATDLAVVRIPQRNLPAATFGPSDEARVGDWVIAIGSPFGLEHTVTVGVLSAIRRAGIGANEIEDYLQTDASINPGNSGGPLVGLHGRVLGINTAIVGQGTGIGFAIPAAMAKRVADQLIARGKVHRAWIGVTFQELTPALARQFGIRDRKGALVSHVHEEGPARQAGVRAGDVIVAIEGRSVQESRDLLREILRYEAGEALHATVWRGGTTRRLRIATVERPHFDRSLAASQPTPPAQDLGLAVAPVSDALKDKLDLEGNAILVSHVTEGSAAGRAGLAAGDVIIKIDRRPPASAYDVARAVANGRALLQVRRGSGGFFAVLALDG